MNILDVIFLILILGSVIYSLIRGLVREIFSFLSIILGFLGASYGYASVAAWLGRWIENQTLTQILGFALLFILIALLISLLGKALASLVKKMDLSWADRLGGAAFGLLKAILLIAIILLVLTAFLPPQSKLILESKISPRIMAIARGLAVLIPKKFYALYEEKEKDLKKYWATQELTGGNILTKGGH